MARLGFEALTHTRSFPFRSTWQSPYSDPENPSAWDGLLPAEVRSEGMPVLIRRDFEATGDLLLRAFVGEPLIYYGHEEDFADGFEFLEDLAAKINRIPGVVWQDLTTLSRSNFLARRLGGTLEIQPFGRRVVIPIPDDVETVTVQPLIKSQARHVHHVSEVPFQRPLQLPDFGQSVIPLREERRLQLEITLSARDAIRPQEVGSPRPNALAIARRVASEARDRMTWLRHKN
jgi:hypothetical protein